MNRLVGAGQIRLVAESPARPDGETHDTILGSQDPHYVLAEHLPNPEGTACSSCGFTYSTDRPLCPPVVEALRTLTARAHTRSFSDYSTNQLRALEREHCGTGRCRRCGFVYTPAIRVCPTSRRIAIELESRFKAPMSQVRAGQGLCSGKGQVWTVSGNKSAPWRQAVAACAQCPLLTSCTTELDRRLASGEKIRDQILAGRLFSGKGDEIAPEMFDAYADRCGAKTKRRKPKPKRRPTRRAATNRTASPSTPAQEVPASPTGGQLTLFKGAVA